MICETCSGKGYIHTTRIERCDECHQEGRVSWTDEQAAEYVRRRELRRAIRANLSKSMGDPMRPTTR